MAGQEHRTVAERLAGSRLLLTGATGFLGKAVLATWLREAPDAGEVVLLVRAADAEAARRRLADELLRSDAFAGIEENLLDPERFRVVPGDLARSRPDPAALADVDVLVHCAASVSFEQPLDEILELNVLGLERLLDALAEAGSHPHVVHVSTAYAAGRRVGLVLERASGTVPGEPHVDLDAELAAARAWRRDLEGRSREPELLRRFEAEARHEIGPAGALSVATRAEAARAAWVGSELVERGRARARALGWSDTYALSKALAERAAVRRAPRALTIVRPSVVESALEHPYPGWIEGLKVADPVILAYARGLVPRFPGEPSVRFDVVPVDLAAQACVVAAAHPPDGGRRTIHVTSGARNPLRVREISAEITRSFQTHPLPDEEGLPVAVGDWRFAPSSRVRRALDRGEAGLRLGRRALDRVALPRVDAVERRLHRERRRLERLRRLAEIYGPYVEVDCVFDDREAQALQARLTDAEREGLDFDAARIDWPAYLHDVHLPALRRLVSAPRPARRIVRTPAAVELNGGSPAIAFFDVEGVVVDATIAHAYAWLRGRTMPGVDRAVWLAALAARVPAWQVLDRGSRAELIRAFYRDYAGLPADEMRAHARDVLSEFLLPRLQHAAVRRIRAHRARGDRVVLLTGALDFLVAPLEHLADEVVAARLVERHGAFTGELAEPPLTADGRASVALARATDHGVALAACHAYADAVSDLPLLEAVGHPHAVNPDFRLAREARRRRWPVLEWATEPGARTVPVVAG